MEFYNVFVVIVCIECLGYSIGMGNFNEVGGFFELREWSWELKEVKVVRV